MVPKVSGAGQLLGKRSECVSCFDGVVKGLH